MASNWNSYQGNQTGGGEKFNSESAYGHQKQSGTFKGTPKGEDYNNQYQQDGGRYNPPLHVQGNLDGEQRGDGKGYQGGSGGYNDGGHGRDYHGGVKGRDYNGGGYDRDCDRGGYGRDYSGGSGHGRDNSKSGQGRDYNGGGQRRYYNGGGREREYSGGRYNRSERGGNVHSSFPSDRYYPRAQQYQDGYRDGGGRYGPGRRGSEGSSSRGRNSEVSGRGGKSDNTSCMAYQSPSNRPRDEREIFDTIPQGDNFNLYENPKIEFNGDNPPGCFNTFDEAELSQSVRENINKSKYKEMTAIQRYAIPTILSGRDLMGCAETGCGKTAAYLIPIISVMLKHAVYKDPNIDGVLSPTTLILAPTRELALQIYQESQKFAYSSNMKTGIYYGGTSLIHQQRILSEGCHILVATPGRLLDCLEKRKVILSHVKFLVIDEADRMLDLGFIPSVKRIVHDFGIPNVTNRKTIMFSATFPDEIQRLAFDFLNRKYLFLTVGKSGATPKCIKQRILRVPQPEKLNRLMQLLMDLQGQKILVFVENKRQADLLASQVCQEHMQATSIHSSRMQQEREQALFEFKSGKRPILIATSVAARGLDIKNVDHVINYDLPRYDFNEYVHRIGRTGRIGNSGMATSFFDPSVDACVSRSLVHILSLSEQDIPTFLEEIAENAIGTNTGFGKNWGDFGGTDHRTYSHGSPLSKERGHQGYGADDHGETYDPHPIAQYPPRSPSHSFRSNQGSNYHSGTQQLSQGPPSNPVQAAPTSSPKGESKESSHWD